MRSIHLVVHACPAQFKTTPDAGPLAIHPSQLNEPFPISFETLLERLADLPRMFCEPDGSFVWVGERSAATASPWQIDGNISDSPRGVIAVELKGTTDWEPLAQLLRCFDWPQTRLVFQLVHEAIFVDANSLESWLRSGRLSHESR